MAEPIPIAQGFYVSDALPISVQRAVNWRPNVPQTSTITDANLFGTEGINLLFNISEIDSCRGAHTFVDIPYFVINNQLYRLNRTIVDNVDVFSVDALGAIEGVERVFMADNGSQLCIVAPPDSQTAGKSYIFTTGPDTLTEITDVNFDGPAASVIYASGYFVFHKTDGKKFFNSPLQNGIGPYDPLDFNTADADPDQIRAIGVLNNQLYVIGSITTQVFRDIGRAPSPFSPISGATINVGITFPQTLVFFNDGLAFVGAAENESPAVWLIAGGSKTKISTTAIDNELSKINLDKNTNDVFSWSYGESGAYFLGITTPDTTFVYDLVNGRWHERQSVVETELTRYRASHMISAYNRVIVGDLESGKIGELRKDVYTEYGVLIRRKVISRPFDNTGDPANISYIEAVVENGQGLTSDITVQTGVNSLGVPTMATGGSDPTIDFSWSTDGGRTFKGFIPRKTGKIGEYNVRQIWRRLETFDRQVVLQFESATPTKSTLIKVEADFG